MKSGWKEGFFALFLIVLVLIVLADNPITGEVTAPDLLIQGFEHEGATSTVIVKGTQTEAEIYVKNYDIKERRKYPDGCKQLEKGGFSCGASAIFINCEKPYAGIGRVVIEPTTSNLISMAFLVGEETTCVLAIGKKQYVLQLSEGKPLKEGYVVVVDVKNQFEPYKIILPGRKPGLMNNLWRMGKNLFYGIPRLKEYSMHPAEETSTESVVKVRAEFADWRRLEDVQFEARCEDGTGKRVDLKDLGNGNYENTIDFRGSNNVRCRGDIVAVYA